MYTIFFYAEEQSSLLTLVVKYFLRWHTSLFNAGMINTMRNKKLIIKLTH